MKKDNLTIGFVSSYLPRECGIATFSNNLEIEIKKIYPNIKMKIIAMNDKKYKYSKKVVFQINQNNDQSYIEAAQFINQSDIDVVSLQHEFGLYGGFKGNKILLLLERLTKPVVVTLHTVPITSKYSLPNNIRSRKTKMKLLKKISCYVKKITVMINTSKEFLSDTLDIPNSKIQVIPHGAPEISSKVLLKYQSQRKLLKFDKDDFIITTFGLIIPKKGLEYMIKALPKIIAANPQKKIKYLIAGQMHPRQPKTYLDYLKDLTKKLKLSNNVIFDNRYLTYDEIYRYLAITNIYITPYYSREQASSGTLSYAIAAGCCIVSTPYVFALEMIERKKIGQLVNFKDPNSIANIVSGLIKNPDLINKYKKNSYELGESIHWGKVAKKYIDLFKYTKGLK